MTGSFGSISTELPGCVYLENERVVGFGAAVVHRVQTAAVAAGVHVADDAADADIFRRLGRLRQRLQPQIKSNQIKSNQINQSTRRATSNGRMFPFGRWHRAVSNRVTEALNRWRGLQINHSEAENSKEKSAKM